MFTAIANKILDLDNAASDRGWVSQLMMDGGWSILLGLKKKMDGNFRDRLHGYTDQDDVDLITYYRNNAPALAKAYIELEKKYEKLAKVLPSNSR